MCKHDLFVELFFNFLITKGDINNLCTWTGAEEQAAVLSGCPRLPVSPPSHQLTQDSSQACATGTTCTAQHAYTVCSISCLENFSKGSKVQPQIVQRVNNYTV